jgi:hypothetical protein
MAIPMRSRTSLQSVITGRGWTAFRLPVGSNSMVEAR